MAGALRLPALRNPRGWLPTYTLCRVGKRSAPTVPTHALCRVGKRSAPAVKPRPSVGWVSKAHPPSPGPEPAALFTGNSGSYRWSCYRDRTYGPASGRRHG
nr:hypothetical protein FQY85_01055 [Cronobacter turicensis]